jgi:hypothetical protein
MCTEWLNSWRQLQRNALEIEWYQFGRGVAVSAKDASCHSLTLHHILNLLHEPHFAAETFQFYHMRGLLFSFCVILALCYLVQPGQCSGSSHGLDV